MLQKLIGKIWRTIPRGARGTIVRLTQPSFVVSAGVTIFDDQDRVLLLNHVLRLGSGWDFPGGFLHHGEQPEDAVRREVLEETGVTITDLKLIRARTINRHIEFWFCARGNGEPQVLTNEIIEARWFRENELPPRSDRKFDKYIAQAKQIRKNKS